MTFVSYERDGQIAVLTIRREEKLNAINAEVLEGIDAAVAQASEDGVRAAILTGAGKAFVAGADIGAMAHWTPEEAEAFALKGQTIFKRMEDASFPFIAAVNGFALGGGCELALACDFIYASEKAKFGQPEVKLGVLPGFGGTQRLLRRVGVGQARELCYSGRIINAVEALRIGLANRVVAPEDLPDAAISTANEIAAQGPLGVQRCKAIFEFGADKDLHVANAKEAAFFGECFTSSDQREGMTAFLEKRAANFQGK